MNKNSEVLRLTSPRGGELSSRNVCEWPQAEPWDIGFFELHRPANESVLLTTDGSIATITLNHPEKLNAFDGTLIESLARVLEEVRSNSGKIRCLVVTGAGRGFCAGADLDYLIRLRQENNLSEFRTLLERGRRIVTTLREIPIPVIASVNGATAGGGCSLALACDIRIAAETARFTQAFAKIGVHADFGATFFLPQLMGEARARELMLLGETISANEACRLGMVSQVVALEQLKLATQKLIEILISRAPLSLALMKQTLAQASQAEFQRALDRELQAQLQCFQSQDFLRGIEAFVHKTTAQFEGK